MSEVRTGVLSHIPADASGISTNDHISSHEDDSSPIADMHPPFLKKGMLGEAVMKLQEMLIREDLHVAVDAVFGPETEAALKIFQADQGLTVDGEVGPATWEQFDDCGNPFVR